MYNFGGPKTGAAGAAVPNAEFGTGYDVGYGYGPDFGAPVATGYGYGAPVVAPTTGFGTGRGFALIVVLFILLVIIGASWASPGTV